MPRTIEGIVEAHRTARELRQQGKPVWSAEIKIKDLLGDNDSDERSIVVAKEIAARFRKGLPDATFDVRSDDYDDEITSIIEDLEIFHDGMGVDNSEVLNERLDEIYDWADVKRVWIG